MNPFQFNRKAIGIFLTAFYPNKQAFLEQLLKLQEQDIDFIEIGIPYSDPIADGPVIQHTSALALKEGFTINALFELLKTNKARFCKPLVLMGYGNQVLQFGITSFMHQSKEIDVKALIFPDLSIEMMSKHPEFSANKHIPFVHLVTPNTSDERISQLAEQCNNSFIYLVGSSQTTGGNYDLTSQLDRYATIKNHCKNTPVFLGFGIDSASKKEEAFQTVDGVIVGSAFLKAISEKREQEFLNQLISC